MSENLRWREYYYYKGLNNPQVRQEGRPYYDISGNSSVHSIDKLFLKGIESDLVALKDSLERKIPWKCLHAHEERIAEKLIDAEGRLTERKISECLCPGEKRLLSPQCAHVRAEGIGTDPFGEEINALMELGILDQDSWMEWYKDMYKSIERRDRAVGYERGVPKEEKKFPLHMIREEQSTDVAELQNKKTVLLHIIDTLLSAMKKAD